METKSELTARIAEVLEPRREILEAYLFGSQARGSVTLKVTLTSLFSSMKSWLNPASSVTNPS